MLVAAMLGVILPTAAHADPDWPQAVDSNICTVESAVNGGVILGYTNGKYALLSSAGAVITTTDTGMDGVCDTSTPQYALTADGTIITTGMNGSGKKRVVAYKNGALLWQNTLVDLCSNQVSSYSWNNANAGADGNVTLMLNSTCSSNREMMSIDPADGSINWQVAVQAWADPMRQSPYSDGIVYRAANNKFVYLTYAGTVDTTKTFTIPSGVLVYDYHTVGFDGSLAVQIKDTSGAYGTSGKSYMYFRNANNTETLREVPTWNQDNRLRMMPNGDVLVTSPSTGHCSSSPYFAAAEIVHRTGSTVFNCLYAPWNMNYLYNANSKTDLFEFVDDNGNIIVTSLYKKTVGGTTRGHTLISVFGSSGQLRSVWSSEQINPSATYWLGTYNVGMHDGHLYAVFGDYWDTSSNKTLHRIDVSNIGMDYPRGRVLGHGAYPASGQRYVALGDSFSSGEGNPPFFPWTDTTPNQCHRSSDAYPVQLSMDSSADLNLVDFVACSGAKKDDIVNGQNGEPPQLDALTPDTDVATISIGGNDVGFKEYITACHHPAQNCEVGSTQYADSSNKITNELPAKLSSLFSSVLSRVGSTTKVVVVGYPRIIESTSGSLGNCALINTNERSAAVQLADLLDQTVADAVDDAQDTRLGYASAIGASSPFNGHDMCSTDNYINPYQVSPYPEAYIAHPNQEGHAAYAQIIKDYLS